MFFRGAFQPNRIFITNTAPAKHTVMLFAMMIGHEPSNIPYSNQSPTPQVKAMYIPREISLVWRVRQTCHTWGMNAVVVSTAAILPIKSVNCIFIPR